MALPKEFSVAKQDGQVRLTIYSASGMPVCYQLEVPDYQGAQMARLPLPENLVTVETVRAVFQKSVGRFTNRRGEPLDKNSRSPFPDFSLKVKKPNAPGEATIWGRHIPACL